ncbi:hypothetical protein TTRE_0000981201 [Trichuris trichiura]|uniref:Uncharacterized protein n=1 Tax=Trichuris trichiura TaxID=36087 RepID=A0A077ZNF7_TRITR|nr:hypothetical protein TTRE_0000981201 [Trichuris trichiura]
MSDCIFESPNFMHYKIINYCLYSETVKCTVKIMILVYYSSFMTKFNIFSYLFLILHRGGLLLVLVYMSALVPSSYLRGGALWYASIPIIHLGIMPTTRPL